MFTKAQVGTLNDARDVLRAIEKEALDAGGAAKTSHIGMNFGKLSEALDNAGGAIFNVLNVAHSYCEVELTEEQIHNRPESNDD